MSWPSAAACATNSGYISPRSLDSAEPCSAITKPRASTARYLTGRRMSRRVRPIDVAISTRNASGITMNRPRNAPCNHDGSGQNRLSP